MPARIAVLLLAFALPGAAGAEARLAVSAVVVRTVHVALHGRPVALMVTQADLERGYVEAPAGSRLAVKTNSREPVVVSFIAGGAFAAVELPDASASIVVPGSARGVSVREFELRYRVWLAPNAEPGLHAWPVRVVASPL